MKYVGCGSAPHDVVNDVNIDWRLVMKRVMTMGKTMIASKRRDRIITYEETPSTAK